MATESLDVEIIPHGEADPTFLSDLGDLCSDLVDADPPFIFILQFFIALDKHQSLLHFISSQRFIKNQTVITTSIHAMSYDPAHRFMIKWK